MNDSSSFSHCVGGGRRRRGALSTAFKSTRYTHSVRVREEKRRKKKEYKSKSSSITQLMTTRDRKKEKKTTGKRYPVTMVDRQRSHLSLSLPLSPSPASSARMYTNPNARYQCARKKKLKKRDHLVRLVVSCCCFTLLTLDGVHLFYLCLPLLKNCKKFTEEILI